MSKPLAILVADSHYDKDNIGEVDDVLDQALELALEQGAEYIFHLGDVFTNRVGQGLRVLLAFRRWLRKCNERNIEVWMIAGNHDKTDLDAEESYLDVYSSYDNVTVISEPTYWNFKGVVVGFLPYFKEEGTYPARLDELIEEFQMRTNELKQVLLTHIAVDGVANNDGTEVTNDLDIKRFSYFDEVFVGHYHNRSDVGKNIHYIGSARPNNYGEDNEKGFTILYTDATYEYVNAKFRKYVKITVDLDKTDKKVLEKWRKKFEGSLNNVRFVLKGTEEQLSAISSASFEESGIDIKKEDKRA